MIYCLNTLQKYISKNNLYLNFFINMDRWADQCLPYPHDKNRRTDEFSYVGQNYAWRSFAKLEEEEHVLGRMVELWYDEV